MKHISVIQHFTILQYQAQIKHNNQTHSDLNHDCTESIKLSEIPVIQEHTADAYSATK